MPLAGHAILSEQNVDVNLGMNETHNAGATEWRTLW